MTDVDQQERAVDRLTLHYGTRGPVELEIWHEDQDAATHVFTDNPSQGSQSEDLTRKLRRAGFQLVEVGGQPESDGEQGWNIHRFECPDCGSVTRADRVVGCFRCGTEMKHQKKITEIEVPADVE